MRTLYSYGIKYSCSDWLITLMRSFEKVSESSQTDWLYTNLLNRLFFFIKRFCNNHHPAAYVQGTVWKYRKNVKSVLFCPDEILLPGKYAATVTNHTDQLFRIESGRWLIFSTISLIVMDKRKLSFVALFHFFFFFLIRRTSLKWFPPFGYLLNWLCESATIFCALLTVLPMMCLSIGLAWLSMGALKVIIDDLYDLKITKLSTFKRRRDKINMHLLKVIKLHSYLKQLSLRFSH